MSEKINIKICKQRISHKNYFIFGVSLSLLFCLLTSGYLGYSYSKKQSTQQLTPTINKEKLNITNNIVYFDVIKENNDIKFFNKIIHYKSNFLETSNNIQFIKNKLNKNKLNDLIIKKDKIINNNNFKNESNKNGEITIRGCGAATKGTKARGPMA